MRSAGAGERHRSAERGGRRRSPGVSSSGSPRPSTPRAIGSEGPRAARPLVRIAALSLGAVAALALGACDGAGDAGEPTVPPLGEVAVIERAGDDGAAPEPEATATPRPTALPIELDVTMVSAPERAEGDVVDLRPGPWSPDGRSLVVWRVVGLDAEGREVGRLGIADAGVPSSGAGAEDEVDAQAETAPRLAWESGDVEAAFGIDRAADWLRDGLLAIARSDGMLVFPDGREVAEGDSVTGLRGQVRQILVAPNGRRWLAIGADRVWLVGDDRVAREIAGTQVDGARAWSWRSDSGALAVATGGTYYTLDAETAALELVAEIEPVYPERQPPQPRWLAGGRLLLTAPAAAGGGGAIQGDGEGAMEGVGEGDEVGEGLEGNGADGARATTVAGFVHRVVDPAAQSATDLHVLLGLEANPTAPYDSAAWVSPDGRYILYPEVVPAAGGGAAQRATWIYDVPGGRAREHPPVGQPTWSPDGLRFAWVEAGTLLVGGVEAGAPVSPAPDVAADGAERPVWSPDGRWILFAGADGSMHLVRADGLAGPVVVAENAVWSPPPTWSPAGDRFAAAIGSAPEGEDGEGDADGSQAGEPDPDPSGGTPDAPRLVIVQPAIR